MRTPPRTLSERYLDFGFGSRRVEPKRQRALHRHNEVELILLEKGGIDHLVGTRRVRLRAGKLAVFWGAIPHGPLGIAPATVVHRLTLPLSWFLEWRLPAAFTQAILAGETVAENDDRNAAADLALFRRWHDDLGQESPDRRKVVLLECEARLRRLVLSFTPLTAAGHKAGEPAPRDPTRIERMSRYVAMHYTKPLRIADIARDAGLNPDYAATLFRKACGRSLVDYVNEHRLWHAQRLLATTDTKIIDIAFLTGFGSTSRFYSAFKRGCARTPREYRSAMAMSGATAPPAA